METKLPLATGSPLNSKCFPLSQHEVQSHLPLHFEGDPQVNYPYYFISKDNKHCVHLHNNEFQGDLACA